MRPLDAVFSLPEQKLLGLTLPDPQRDFGTLEVLKHMGNSRSACMRVVERWLAAGLLRERRVGNQRRLSANPEFLLYPELRQMVVKTVGVAEPLCAALRPLAASISEAFIFGSVAAGSDQSDSDIDLALVGLVDLFALSPRIDQAQAQLGRRVHLSVYDPEDWASKGDPVLESIRRGPRIDLMDMLRGPTC